jgi:hypothetical protein
VLSTPVFSVSTIPSLLNTCFPLPASFQQFSVLPC